MSIGTIIVLIIFLIIILACLIGIIMAINFQKKQNKKYNNCVKLINEKKTDTIKIKDGLTNEEINKIDPSVDADKLMLELYNTYLDLENKMKSFDKNLDMTLTGFMKDFYISKIDNYSNSGFSDTTDGIELIGYSIIEFKKNLLKFRIKMNCFNYKKKNNKIVSGSNLEKVEQVIILTFKKVENKWLINKYEKVYERKLSN